MARENTPTDNGVAERHENDVTTAAILMLEPNYPKANTPHIGEDLRLPIVENFKDENEKVISILAELVDRTLFDDLSFENSLAFQFIDKKLEEIYSIIQNNPETTRGYVEQAIEPVEDSLVELHRKVDSLLPKAKTRVDKQPLRDPIDMNWLPVFLANAGSWAVRRKDLKQAQLRVAYTLLYFTGLRVNEIREFKRENIDNAIKSSQVSVIHHKTQQPYIHILSKNGVNKLKELKLECDIIFTKYNFKYLFGKNKPMHQLSVIRLINKDLKGTCEVNNIPYNIKSHSFRINMISSLLKNTSVQNAAQIIGHKNVKSTMSYQRYALSKDEIQKLLEEIDK